MWLSFQYVEVKSLKKKYYNYELSTPRYMLMVHKGKYPSIYSLLYSWFTYSKSDEISILKQV